MSITNNRFKKTNKIDEYTNKINQSHSVKWVILAAFFAIVFFLVFTGLVPRNIEIEEGDIATENIVAPRRIVDTLMTEALRIQAENLTAPIYDYIPSAYSESQNTIEGFVSAVSNLHVETLTQSGVDSINQIYGIELSMDDYLYLADLSSTSLDELKDAVLAILKEAYAGEIKGAELEAFRTSVSAQIEDYDLRSRMESIGAVMIRSVLQPNMILNEEATELAKESARESVSEVVYEAGQTIISRGDIVTAHQIELLKQSGLLKTGLFDNVSMAVGLPLLILVLIGLYISYLYSYHKEIFTNNKMLLLIAIQFVLMLAIGQLAGVFSVYLIPVSMMTMTLCLVFNSRIAVQTNLFLMLFLAVGLYLDIDSFLYLAISGYTGVIYMRQMSSRSDIFKTGILVSLVNVMVILIINVYRDNLNIHIFNELFYGIGSGIISALLANGMLMFWEGIFNILTPFKLLEMSNPSDELMQKLITEAPGTYHHSLVVSNMAESAAKKIGADLLLARVGAYYHDIGKAEKAIYFKENQIDVQNPHDFITPDVSAKIIKNHVGDGIYLAEKNRVPEEIIDFIRMHHGTTEIAYFKAKADESGYHGDEDFHYPGTLPHTKETSIVMLADSVEAAVRSMDEHDSDEVRLMIENIIKHKIESGQLEESPLSFAEIETIKETFFEILSSVYHNRIKYPNQIKQEDQKNEMLTDGDNA